MCTNHSLINGVSGFVWEDAGGQAGHDLFHTELVSCLQHVVVDVDVVSLKDIYNIRSENNAD